MSVSWGAPGAVDDESYWERIRARFPLDPDLVYLNSAALGVPPDPVIAAVHEGYLRLSQDPDAGKIDYRRYNEEVAIPELAALMGARPEELAINRNASVGLELVADGVNGLRAGDEILTTSHEHPVGVKPWRARAAREGLVVREVDLPSPVEDAAQLIEPLRAAITDRTRVLAFCHVTRGGIRYPIEAMCRLGREHGLIIAIDGAQAVGRVPVDLTAYDCDLYAASMHKWLLAPSGPACCTYGRSSRSASARSPRRPDPPPRGTRRRARSTCRRAPASAWRWRGCDRSAWARSRRATICWPTGSAPGLRRFPA